MAELIPNNGVLVTREAEPQKKPARLRRKGVRLGAKLIVLSAFLLPLAVALSVNFDSPIPFWVPFIIFLLGLAQAVYTLLFGKHDPREVSESQPRELSATGRRPNLSAAHNTQTPIDYSKRIKTAEMVSPQSVTEHTTQLFEDDQSVLK
ncbi:MAG TPA: hypothetical protein VN956_11525 [Pyrinomonadaceae bacterium]|nr:hypothetical protein [Pyrinomonadaceae bacterium]